MQALAYDRDLFGAEAFHGHAVDLFGQRHELVAQGAAGVGQEHIDLLAAVGLLAEEVNQIALDGIDPAVIAAARDMLLRMIHNLAADEQKQSLEERRMPSTRQISSLLDRARKPVKVDADSKLRPMGKTN